MLDSSEIIQIKEKQPGVTMGVGVAWGGVATEGRRLLVYTQGSIQQLGGASTTKNTNCNANYYRKGRTCQ